MTPRRFSVHGAVLALVLAACGPTPPPSRVTWDCPAEWVPSARGGCGPAVLLCAPDGGAAADVCSSTDLTTPHAAVPTDAGDATTFYLLADGGIGGGWHEDGDDAGPPSPDFNPLAATPCPTGWNRAADGTCDPALRTDCTASSGALPGGLCTLTTTADCPTTDYADVSAEAGSDLVVHVRAGAPAAGADGSTAHPYSSLTDGLTAIGANGWVLLAAGLYPISEVLMHGHAHVVGQCAGRVRLASSGAAGLVANGRGAVVDIRGVTVANAAEGFVASEGAQLRLAHVRASSSYLAGMLARSAGTMVTIDDFLIDGVRGMASMVARGVVAQDTAVVQASHVAMHAVRGIGASVAFGGRLTIDDSVIRDSPTGIDADIPGVMADGTDASVVAHRVVEVDLLGPGVQSQAGANVVVEDAVIRPLRPVDTTVVLPYVAVLATDGASLHATRLFVNNAATSVLAQGPSTQIEISDSVISNQVPVTLYDLAAITADLGASIVARRIRLDHVQPGGVLGGDRDTSIDLRDSVVMETAGAAVQPGSVGIAAVRGASVTAVRVGVYRYGTFGVYAGDPDTHLTMTDSTVSDAVNDPMGGHGVFATLGATVSLSRMRIASAQAAGILAAAASTTLNATDVLVDHVIARQPANADGACAAAIRGAGVTLSHVLFHDCTEAGLWIASAAHVTATDAIIHSVQPNGWGYGVGTLVVGNAQLDGARFGVEDVAGAGLGAAILETDRFPVAGTVTAGDIFVRNVHPGTISVMRTGPDSAVPAGTPLAFGINAATGSNIDASRVTIQDVQYGFGNHEGELSLRTGVITGALLHAGARSSPTSVTTLVGVTYAGNVDDSVITLSTLPQASSLTDPTDPCGSMSCF